MRAMRRSRRAILARVRSPAVLPVGALLFAAVALLGTAAATPPFAEQAYFVVGVPGPTPHPDGAYVLPLSDPVAIATARQTLSAPSSSLIVFAVVEQGADGINRDWYQAGRPLWHWHVVEFQGFGELGMELCDGTPDQVEARMVNATPGARELICFWSWRLLEEVTPVPLDAPTWGTIKAGFRQE